jgi:hypothetical protein
MSFPSFHKVRDNLVLEELTIGPDMVALLPHAFYSNNIPVLPARAPSRPPGNGGQGQEHGHDRCRYRKYDGRRHNAFGQGNKPCPAPPPWPSFYNSWTKTINMYPSLASEGGGAATPPSTAAGSHLCARLDHGRSSIHTTLGSNPDSITDVHRPAATCHISILDALARLVGPAVAAQLLQHDDAPDAALTYGVGHRLRCIESHHARYW